MKLTLPTTMLAAGTLAVGMSAHSAGVNKVHKWCLHKTYNKADDCGYDSLAQCHMVERTPGECIINPKWTALHGNNTTGMKPMEK